MIRNNTPFSAEILPCIENYHGVKKNVVIKATLDVNGLVVSHGQGLPVCNGDVYFDLEGFDQVLRFESDLAPRKSFVDVIVNAVAHAPGGIPVPYFDAGVRVNNEVRAIRVFGKRVWQSRLNCVANIVSQTHVVSLPVIYPLAYGGVRDSDACLSNPSGSGFVGKRSIDGILLPQIEWLDSLICSPGDDPAPAGFGCFGKAWLPRRNFLGAYQTLECSAAGLITKLPASFDARFWSCANPRMQFPYDVVRQGTAIQLINLSQSGRVDISIPKIDVAVSILKHGGGEHTYHPRFDTVTIEPEFGHFALTWRHAIEADLAPDIDEVRIDVW